MAAPSPLKRLNRPRSAGGSWRATDVENAGGWTRTRPGSLGLLPSGPDPVGEWCVPRQPPAPYVDYGRGGRKGDGGLFQFVCRQTIWRLFSLETKREHSMDIRMLIGGEAVGAAGGGVFERKNPFTGEIASRAPSGGVADAKKAVEAAAAAFESWAAIGPNERRALLLKAADLLAGKAGEFGRIVAEETGATAPWGGFNVMLASQMLREAASMTTQIAGEVIPSDKPGTTALAIRQPCGVVLGIAPW